MNRRNIEEARCVVPWCVPAEFVRVKGSNEERICCRAGGFVSPYSLVVEPVLRVRRPQWLEHLVCTSSFRAPPGKNNKLAAKTITTFVMHLLDCCFQAPNVPSLSPQSSSFCPPPPHAPPECTGAVALPLAAAVQAVPSLAPALEQMPACHVQYPWRGALYPVM